MGNALKKLDYLTDPTENQDSVKEPEIFQYVDYRKFLKDRVEYLASINPKFSTRELARRAELSSPFISYVLRSKRNLNEEAGRRVSKAIELNEVEAEYFELIRELELIKSHDEKTEHFKKIEKFRVKNGFGNGKDPLLSYYSDWISIAIRELMGCEGSSTDPKKIKKALNFKSSLGGIKKSLNSLFDCGFLVKNETGEAKTPEEFLNFDGKVYQMAIREFHSQMLERAKESMTELTPENRRISGVTMPISSKSFPKIVDLMKRFDAELRKIEEEDDGEKDRVINISQFAFILGQWKKEESEEGSND
jgi:uncharacterized protein (TIGR02147 family)